MKEKELWPLNTSACEIEDLYLTITAPPSSHFVILSRLFSTFHPTTVYASIFSDKDQDFLKVAFSILLLLSSLFVGQNVIDFIIGCSFFV